MSCDIALMSLPRDRTDDLSTFIQVMSLKSVRKGPYNNSDVFCGEIWNISLSSGVSKPAYIIQTTIVWKMTVWPVN